MSDSVTDSTPMDLDDPIESNPLYTSSTDSLPTIHPLSGLLIPATTTSLPQVSFYTPGPTSGYETALLR